MVAAQPCFYFDAAGNYVGPPELVQGVDVAALRGFCLQTLAAGYFDLPLCDIATVPPPPSCISAEQRRLLRYCRDQGYTGDDRTANYFCWYALKAPPELAEWDRVADCPPGTEPPPPAPPPPGTAPPPPTAPPAAAPKKTSVGPLVLGAVIAAGVAYLVFS